MNFIPLTFISDPIQVKNQIRNTLILQFVRKITSSTLVPLGSLLSDTAYGFTASARQSGSHRLIRITDIQSGKIDWETVPYCDCETFEQYSLKYGDILVARTGGTVGKTFLISGEVDSAVFASYLIRLRVDRQKVIPEFIFYFLNSYLYWSQITGIKNGSAQPNVNAEKLKGLSVPYCDISIQQEIINLINNGFHEQKDFLELINFIKKVLNSFDRTEQIKKKCKEFREYTSKLKAITLQEAISGKLLSFQSNSTASELLELTELRKKELIQKEIIKKVILPPILPEDEPFTIPKGWLWVRLGELTCKIGSGSTPHGGKEVYQNSGIPFIRSQNVWDNGLNLDEVAYITEITHDKMSGTKVIEGDILLNITGASIGRTCVVPKGLKEANVSQHVSIIRLVDKRLNSFLHLVLLSPYLQDKIMAVQVGISREGLSKKNLELFPIPLPTLPEQEAIVNKVGQMMSVYEQLNEKTIEKEDIMTSLLEVVLREAFNNQAKQ